MTTFPFWPLSRLRVIELGAAIAAPFCTALLADAGAEVIKIETERRPDNLRSNWPQHEGKPGRERSYYYALVNRNKLHLTLDLTNEDGRAAFLELVRVSDVIVENFAAGTMDRLEMSYERIRRANPSIVMLSLSGFGASGPAKNYIAYGMMLEGVTGMAGLTGYLDGPPAHSTFVYNNYISGMWASNLVMAAIADRNRTGQGVWFDISQCEVSLHMMPDAFLQAAVGGSIPQKRENRDAFVPVHGVYKCNGDDKWIALAVRTDDEWRSLCKAMGEPEWPRRPEFATAAGRKLQQPEIDNHLAAWASQVTREEAVATLKRHGVAAGPVYDMGETLADRHLRERGMFPTRAHPVIGAQTMYASPVHIEGTPREVQRYAPLWGEHNAWICGDLLGLPHAESERLVRVGALK